MEDRRPFLVYRDRLGVPSETQFLRRQYVGFSQLRPVWTGRTVLPGATALGGDVRRLGGDGPMGPLRRVLFRYGRGEAVSLLPGVVRASGGMAEAAGPGIGMGGDNGLSGGSFAPVIHAQFARGGALALPLARALRAGLVVTLHGGDVAKQKNWHGTLLAARWPDLLREVVQFVCVSQAVAEIAAARGVPAHKLTVLPIGTLVPPDPPSRQPRHFLFVGRLVEKKGLGVLADAMRRLRAAGDATPLVCVGDGPMRPALAALAAELPGVELTGWLQPEAVAAQMQQAVALIVPSIVATDGDAEGLPSVIPEAMAQACPVLASNHGGMAEAISDGVTGVLVPPNDSAALAEAMARLSADRAAAERLGVSGFHHAANALNAQRQSAKLETLLLGVADRQQKAGQ